MSKDEELTMLRARLAEIEKQEPVAWIGMRGGVRHMTSQWVIAEADAGTYDTPLYASPVQPSQAQAALDAILWYYENCTGSEPSISAFQQMVDRVVKMKPNFCESCAMDIATCDCVTPRPATVTVQPIQGLQSVADALTIEQLNDKVGRLMAVQPSQAGGVSKQDIYDIAHRKATRYVCTAAPSDVMYGFSEMHLLDFVAAINAKESGK